MEIAVVDRPRDRVPDPVAEPVTIETNTYALAQANDIQQAQANHIVKAPVRARIAVPLQVLPNLIAALQEHMRVFSESTGASWDKGPVH